MRRLHALWGALVLVFVVPGCHGPAEPAPIHAEGYQVVFEDQFNDTTLDDQWARHFPWYGPPPDGAVVEGFNVVTLRSRQSDGWPELNISTLGQRSATGPPFYPQAVAFERGNGKYFEARIRYSDTPHAWPAFWLMSVNHPQLWPTTPCDTIIGEWDIMENFRPTTIGGLSNTVFHAAAHRYRPPSIGCDDHDLMGNIEEDLGTDMTTWHTYGGKWANGQLCSYVDDVLVGCIPEFEAVDTPMYLILSQASRCISACPGVPKPENIDLQVDWVKVWSKP